MPREIFPSSFECDCGHQSDFCEGTVHEMKRRSRSKEVRLGDGPGPAEHVIVFRGGKMVAIRCPRSVEQNGSTGTKSTVPAIVVLSPSVGKRRMAWMPRPDQIENERGG